MVSFYSLPSTVVNNPLHKTIVAAYSFYNVATSMSLQDLMSDALVLAKNVSTSVIGNPNGRVLLKHENQRVISLIDY